MTTRALLLPCGLLLVLASAASAQSVNAPPPAIDPPATVNAPSPRPPAPPSQAGLPPQRIVAMVRASGFDPIGRPVRRGNLYVQRAIDPNDVEYRLVIDSLTGRTVSVRAVGIAGPYAAAPGYGPYPPPPPRLYGRYFGPPPDDYGFGYGSPRPPRSVPNAHLPPPQPPPSASAQPNAQPSASPQPRPQPSTTAQAPLPRPKPYVMEATGSIPADSPKTPPPDSQKAPEPPKAAPQAHGAAAMPPVAPLD